MKFDKLIGPQIAQLWFVFLIIGGIIWVGWFLSQDINTKAVGNDIEAVEGDADGSDASDNSAKDTPPPEFGVVSDVIDSLTIVLDNQYLVRYLGVITPTTLREVECFGKEALLANESLVGKTVRLEEDPVLARASDMAWIRYVWVAEDELSQEAYAKALSGAPVAGLNLPAASPEVALVNPEKAEDAASAPDKQLIDDLTGDDITMGDREDSALDDEGVIEKAQPEENKIKEYMVSERIIEMGLGFPLLSKEMTYHEKLSAAARFSSATKRGLWGACEISENDNGLLRTQVLTECVIKGTKLLDGHKIFRTPECKSYKDTVVIDYKDDKWLCSEEEAKELGFAKAIDC